MTDEAQGYCVEYKPSRREKFWRKLGFRHHLGDDNLPHENWQGWMQTNSGITLDWADRLRLLVSGHLKVRHTYHIDTPSPTEIHTRFDWEIVAPGTHRIPRN
jgi:hypothetical protein